MQTIRTTTERGLKIVAKVDGDTVKSIKMDVVDLEITQDEKVFFGSMGGVQFVKMSLYRGAWVVQSAQWSANLNA